jgi:hypothetical protein
MMSMAPAVPCLTVEADGRHEKPSERGKEHRRDGWRGRKQCSACNILKKKERDADFSTTDWPPIQSSRQKPRQGRVAGAKCV